MKVLRIKFSEDRIVDAIKLANECRENKIIPFMEPQLNQSPEKMVNYLEVRKVK